MEDIETLNPFAYSSRYSLRTKKKYYLILGLVLSIILLQLFIIGSGYVVSVREGGKTDQTRKEVHDFIVFGQEFLYNASLDLQDLMSYVRTQTNDASFQIARAVGRIYSLEREVRHNMTDINTRVVKISQQVDTMAAQVNHTTAVIDDINQRFTRLVERF